MCNIGYMCKVKQVGIVTELKTGSPCPVDIDDGWNLLDITRSKNTCRPDSTAEEFGTAICGDDECFCLCLEGRKDLVSYFI